MEILDILKEVTVNCKDNQHTFTVADRMEAIARLLDGSAYGTIYAGGLCRIYAKEPIDDKPVILVSSHVDCVYSRLFCEKTENGLLRGTFDNSLSNACVIWNMLVGRFDANVIIAFTGDEERDSNGAKEAAGILQAHNAEAVMALVLDVTNEGWRQGCGFTLENDLGVDMLTAHRIIQALDDWGAAYGFVHHAEPDETWDYIELGIPSLTAGIPVGGNMHSDEGCIANPASLPIYCDALVRITNAAQNQEMSGACRTAEEVKMEAEEG